MTLRQLECFVAVAESGTMTAAARRLYVSQSAVSLAMAGLERSLGTQLVIRHRARKLELTSAGRRLLPEVKSLLAHADDVRSSAEEHGTILRGSLTVGCFRTSAPYLLPELLERFREEQPAVTLRFVEGSSEELAAELHSGRCDLAVLYHRGLGPGLDTELLRTMVPYVLVSPAHPLAGRASLTIPEVAAHDMIMLDVQPSRTYFDALFARAGCTPRVRHHASSYELVRTLVGRNLGYAILLSRATVATSYEGHPIVTIPLGDDPLTDDLVLAWPAGVRLSRRAKAFAELCRRTIR